MFGWVHEIWDKMPLLVEGIPAVCCRVVIPVMFILTSKNYFTFYVIINQDCLCVVLTFFVLSGACLFRMSVRMVLYSWTKWSNSSFRLTKVSLNLARSYLNRLYLPKGYFSLDFYCTFPPSAQHWWKHDLIRWSPPWSLQHSLKFLLWLLGLWYAGTGEWWNPHDSANQVHWESLQMW